MTESVVIRPHAGPQNNFLVSEADIAIYGGAAGGGKTWALLSEPLRHIDNPQFGAVLFRRTYPEITNQGGLWDESNKIYPFLKALPKVINCEWVFPGGAAVSFRHLQHEKDRLAWQGSQIPMIGFDELTNFEESQFWYLLSRNRSTCGIRPYVRATTNPDADSWVAKLIDWWIDTETGYPIPERAGVVRWFIRRDDQLLWADSPEELRAGYSHAEPKSLTFVPSKLDDNPTLLEKDPGYRANLNALPEVDRLRLLGGNWKVRQQGGLFFKVGQMPIITAAPSGLSLCRAWDLAATEGEGDWTVGSKVGMLGMGDSRRFFILDVIRGQWSPDDVDARIKQAAALDGPCCRIKLPQDPGQAGKKQAQQLVRMLAGLNVAAVPVTGPKTARAAGLASQANIGNVSLLAGPWNAALLSEFDSFPTKGRPDDQVDATADAFNELSCKRNFLVGVG